jgi:hypothetical protein
MHTRCVYIATLFGALIAPATVVASERVDICAQYSATGDTYHVAAISTLPTETPSSVRPIIAQEGRASRAAGTTPPASR